MNFSKGKWRFSTKGGSLVRQEGALPVIWTHPVLLSYTSEVILHHPGGQGRPETFSIGHGCHSSLSCRQALPHPAVAPGTVLGPCVSPLPTPLFTDSMVWCLKIRSCPQARVSSKALWNNEWPSIILGHTYYKRPSRNEILGIEKTSV